MCSDKDKYNEDSVIKTQIPHDCSLWGIHCT